MHSVNKRETVLIPFLHTRLWSHHPQSVHRTWLCISSSLTIQYLALAFPSKYPMWKSWWEGTRSEKLLVSLSFSSEGVWTSVIWCQVRTMKSLLWINNFDFVSVFCIVPIVACYCRWRTLRLKGRKGTSNEQWQIHLASMKNEIVEVSAKAVIRITYGPFNCQGAIWCPR